MSESKPGEWFQRARQAAGLRVPQQWEAGVSPWFLLAVVAASTAAEVGLQRLAVPGPAYFSWRILLGDWWTLAPLLFVAWAVMRGGTPRAGCADAVAGWLTIWVLAMLPATVVLGAVEAAVAHGIAIHPFVLNGTRIGMSLWSIAIAWVTTRRVASRAGTLLVIAVLIATVAISFRVIGQTPWFPDRAESDESDAPSLHLSQGIFEDQQRIWHEAVDALRPQRPGVRDVYAVIFAPYAGEDVFMRESRLVSSVLGERFDAVGRIVELVNHASTASTVPWATPQNLTRTIAEVAKRMDTEEDVLVLYLTSHGGRDGKLAASHWPLEVDPVTAGQVRAALDAAGVRHRVVLVSACYSGTWVSPLQEPGTLVMTAADATHTLYGCGYESPLTYFGRALFDEQLRKTHSFQRAFQAAVPVIRQREEEGRKKDGFSNPQLSVGGAIAPVLEELERRLETSPPT